MSADERIVAQKMWEADKRPCEWDELSEEEKLEWDRMARGAMSAGVLPTVKKEPVKRSSAGLRDALFDALDGLRTGTLDPMRAKAMSGVAKEIVNTVRLEMDIHKLSNPKPDAQFAITSLPLGHEDDVERPLLPPLRQEAQRNVDADGPEIYEGAEHGAGRSNAA